MTGIASYITTDVLTSVTSVTSGLSFW
uniref:Uncharacterized protein n=1 Tax=Rhizophora mucronata TaxID=61149 RepID=A0A2P2ISM1_RHIMU